jgi:hypothetical protein
MRMALVAAGVGINLWATWFLYRIFRLHRVLDDILLKLARR